MGGNQRGWGKMPRGSETWAEPWKWSGHGGVELKPRPKLSKESWLLGQLRRLSLSGPGEGGWGQPAPAAADSLSPWRQTSLSQCQFPRLHLSADLLVGLGHELIMACVRLWDAQFSARDDPADYHLGGCDSGNGDGLHTLPSWRRLSCLILRLQPRPSWRWLRKLTHHTEGCGMSGSAHPRQGCVCSHTVHSHRPCHLWIPKKGSRTHRLRDSGPDSHCTVWINADQNCHKLWKLGCWKTPESSFVSNFPCTGRWRTKAHIGELICPQLQSWQVSKLGL